MSRRQSTGASQPLKLPLLALCAGAMLALPTTSLALATIGYEGSQPGASAFGVFTPASIDPDLAARIADKARDRGLRFTPAGTSAAQRERTVTVAVRIDGSAAKVVSVREAATGAAGLGAGIESVKAARFNLGTARGYQRFARTLALPDGLNGSGVTGSERVGSGIGGAALDDLGLPDLAEFEPARPSAGEKPGRLQPRIELEDGRIAGRSANTLDDLGAQTVDVGGSFRISSKIDVTAGVRLSQERERLGPLTNSVQDSQAVYVGTQIKF